MRIAAIPAGMPMLACSLLIRIIDDLITLQLELIMANQPWKINQEMLVLLLAKS